MAQMLVYTADGEEMVFPVENSSLQVGDLVLLEADNLIPAPVKILSGNIVLANGESVAKGQIAPAGLRIREGKAKGYVAEKGKE